MAYGIKTAQQLKTRYGGLIRKVIDDLPDSEVKETLEWLEEEKKQLTKNRKALK